MFEKMMEHNRKFVEEVMVIGHTNCGVDFLINHPLMPNDVIIKGYIIDTETGKLTPL